MKYFNKDNVYIWFDDSHLVINPNLIFDVTYWQKRNAVIGNAQGRGTTWFIKLDKTEAALRHYRRGGIFGKLVNDRYWFTSLENTRSYAEYELLLKLSSAGVSVPVPIGARVLKARFTYTADLMTEKIANAEDLVGVLNQRPLSRQIYYKIGQEIQKMHNLGVNHTDLNIHNILLDDQDRVWIIDFDKCYQQSGESWKNSNLERLLRSFKKEVNKLNIHWVEADFEELQIGYRSPLTSSKVT